MQLVTTKLLNGAGCMADKSPKEYGTKWDIKQTGNFLFAHSTRLVWSGKKLLYMHHLSLYSSSVFRRDIIFLARVCRENKSSLFYEDGVFFCIIENWKWILLLTCLPSDSVNSSARSVASRRCTHIRTMDTTSAAKRGSGIIVLIAKMSINTGIRWSAGRVGDDTWEVRKIVAERVRITKKERVKEKVCFWKTGNCPTRKTANKIPRAAMAIDTCAVVETTSYKKHKNSKHTFDKFCIFGILKR